MYLKKIMLGKKKFGKFFPQMLQKIHVYKTGHENLGENTKMIIFTVSPRTEQSVFSPSGKCRYKKTLFRDLAQWLQK